jgi:hypothetical protein
MSLRPSMTRPAQGSNEDGRVARKGGPAFVVVAGWSRACSSRGERAGRAGVGARSHASRRDGVEHAHMRDQRRTQTWRRATDVREHLWVRWECSRRAEVFDVRLVRGRRRPGCLRRPEFADWPTGGRAEERISPPGLTLPPPSGHYEGVEHHITESRHLFEFLVPLCGYGVVAGKEAGSAYEC